MDIVLILSDFEVYLAVGLSKFGLREHAVVFCSVSS